MEEQNTGGNAAPTVDESTINVEVDLDKAIEEARTRLQASKQPVQEARKPSTTEVPEDDDDEDSEDKKLDDDSDDVDSLDSDDVEDEVAEARDDTDTRVAETKKEVEAPKSRKERGKLIREQKETIEQLEARIRKEQAEKETLKQQEEERKQKDEELQKEVLKVIGSKEEFEELTQKVARGDTKAAGRLAQLQANSKFYEKLVEAARLEVRGMFNQSYWNTVSKIPGADPEILKGKLPNALKHVYTLGAQAATTKLQGKIDELEEQVAELQERNKTLRIKLKSGQTRQPVSGGSPVASARKGETTFEDLFMPDGFTPKPEALAKVKSGQLKLTELMSRQQRG